MYYHYGSPKAPNVVFPLQNQNWISILDRARAACRFGIATLWLAQYSLNVVFPLPNQHWISMLDRAQAACEFGIATTLASPCLSINFHQIANIGTILGQHCFATGGKTCYTKLGLTCWLTLQPCAVRVLNNKTTRLCFFYFTRHEQPNSIKMLPLKNPNF